MLAPEFRLEGHMQNSAPSLPPALELLSASFIRWDAEVVAGNTEAVGHYWKITRLAAPLTTAAATDGPEV